MANHINPKVRAYGKARLDFTLRAKNETEWLRGWHDALYEFPFQLSNGWRFGFEYKVDDYAAEIGFFVDQLGFPVVAFSPSYAQFTTPEQDFIFSIAHALEGEISTPPETVRLHLQVLDLEDAVEELQSRDIQFEQKPYLLESSSSMVASFRSPHGISIDLWQSVDQREEETADAGLDDNDDLYHDEDVEAQTQSRYDREIVAQEVDADDDPEYQEEPTDERFEESKRHNYHLWDEDEENHDEFEVDDHNNEAGQPLIFKTSADKDDFLDRLLKETSDRNAESEIQEVNSVQEQEEAGESPKNNRLAKTHSVLRGLREKHHTTGVLQSDVKISSGRAMYGDRLKNTNGDNLGDDLYEDETFSNEELVYQEIDDGDEDYPE